MSTAQRNPGGGGDDHAGTASAPARAPFVLALARAEHAEGTRAIYNRAIETSTATFEMSPKSSFEQVRWIAEHSGAHPAVVALTTTPAPTEGSPPQHGPQDAVVGFGAISPYRPRPAYSTTVESSVYVHHDFRRMGIGQALVLEVLRLAKAHGFHAVIARIAGGNDASVALHQACGFEVIGTEREVGRKFGRWLDVVCMERLL